MTRAIQLHLIHLLFNFNQLASCALTDGLPAATV